MKITAALASALLATSASAAFDKWAPWGKRDYSCINISQGVPDNATVTAGSTVKINFDRNSGRCDSYLDDYKGTDYKLWLYNNPQRGINTLTYDHSVKIKDGIPESAGQVTFTIPTDLPDVADDTVWYLRLDTVLAEAPQMPSLFNALGPFRITTPKSPCSL